MSQKHQPMKYTECKPVSYALNPNRIHLCTQTAQSPEYMQSTSKYNSTRLNGNTLAQLFDYKRATVR